MAEPTEQEQLKTNQHLTKIENAASETSGKIDELISAVKQPATYETDLLKEIKDQGEEQAQTDKKTLKSQKAFHEDVKELTKNSATEKDHNKFMEVMEKKKVGLQEIALKDKKRDDKLKTREDSKMGKWVEKKWDGFKKATGDWLGTVGKLLALIGAWFALNWLKGKDLKKMWEDFLKWAEDFLKDLKEMGDKLKDMGLGTVIGGIVAAYAAWKLAVLAGTKLFTTSTETTKGEIGKEGKLTKQITKLNTQLEELRTKQNAIKRAQKMVTSLEAKSALSEQLRVTNEKITALEAEIEAKTTAANRASNLADNLSDKGKISKELKKANKALAKATAKNNAIAESIKWSKNFDMDSKMGKQLQESNAKFEKAKADKARLLREQRVNEVNRGRIRANLEPLKPGQWVGKDGLIRTGEGVGTVLKGSKSQKQFFGSKELTMMEKTKANFTRFSNWISGTMEKVGQTKAGQNIKGAFKTGGAAADLAWRLTKIFEPVRGYIAAAQASEERGENWAEQFFHGVGGGMHGFNDLIGAVIGFMGQTGKVVEEGSMRGIGMLTGMSEKNRDRMVKNWQEHEHNYFNKLMTFFTDTDEGIQKFGNDMFGAWKEDTKLQNLMAKEGFSVMDMFGLGDEGGAEGFKKFWTGYWTKLRSDDPNIQMKNWHEEKEREREKHDLQMKKKGYVQNFAGNWVDPKNTPADQTLEAMKELLEKLVDFSTPKASDVQRPPQSNTFIQSNPTSYRGGSRGVIDPNQGLLGANPYQFYG